jgi:hypothetical protein
LIDNKTNNVCLFVCLQGATGSSMNAEESKVRKRHFLRHLYIKCIILPRQARDKHRESTQKRDVFSQAQSKLAKLYFKFLLEKIAARIHEEGLAQEIEGAF